MPGLGIVDVTSELKVVPRPGRPRLDWRHRQAAMPGFGASTTSSSPASRAGCPRSRTTSSTARISSSISPTCGFRAPAIAIERERLSPEGRTFFFEGKRESGDLRPVHDEIGREDRPAQAVMRLAGPTRPWACRRAPRPRSERGRLRLPGRRLDARAVHRQRRDPAAEGPAGADPVRALDVSGTRATGTCGPTRAGSPESSRVAGSGVSGKLQFDPVGDVRATRRPRRRQATFPGSPPLTSIRERPGGGRWPCSIRPEPRCASPRPRAGSAAGPFPRQPQRRRRAEGRGRPDRRARIDRDSRAGLLFETKVEVAPGRTRIDRRRPGRPAADRAQPAGHARPRRRRLAARAGLDHLRRRQRPGVRPVRRTDERARRATEAMPLSVLDIGWPELGLGGTASGSLSYRFPAGRSAERRRRTCGCAGSPVPASSCRRARSARSLQDGGRLPPAAMPGIRAVAASEGKMSAAPKRGSRRYRRRGNAASGSPRRRSSPKFATRAGRHAVAPDRESELLDVGGGVAVGADATGTLNNPQIRGSLQTDKGPRRSGRFWSRAW